jgi:hypothetical protein
LVTISVTVSNSGDLEGSYQVVLKINGTTADTEDVTLAGGDSQEVTFTTTQEVAGDYTVVIGDMSASFIVTEITDVTEPDGEPAEFVLSNLSASPAEVGVGETVAITVLVSNTGDLEGTYQLVLEIAGEIVSTRAVTVAGGASQEVTFTTSESAAGGYLVSIGEESTSFTVTPEMDASEETDDAAEPGRLNWWLIGGAIAAAVIVTLFALLIRRQVRSS